MTTRYLLLVAACATLLPLGAAAQPAHDAQVYYAPTLRGLPALTQLFGDDFRPVRLHAVQAPARLAPGQTGTFTAVANVETATLPLRCRWDFGDGRTAEGLSARHRYERPGAYDVQVTVSNGRSEATRTLRVVVEADDGVR